ncbi:hypothetical protein OKA05_10925 [Luteolibacter arcticus]|uniref:RHS repeat-associated core domain-containing protein n=1 Tax=Luteolibacter arcticus TaxID=1581411 RepID=A0ABT3GHS5_9BACT|nr:hypothetical protein [Luteolibacter arcticus]MCW1923067.1 hypothetical protein [Luteolibacter arcticus]
MKTRLPAALLSLVLSSPLLSQEPVPPPLLEFAVGLPGKQVRLTWAAEVGVRYRIERSTDLGGGGGAGGGWKQVALVDATGTAGEWLDPETTQTKSFYRITHPEPEVFSIPEPVLPAGGGELLIHGQRIPDGSKLVLLVEGVPMEFALTSMGGGVWRAAALLGGIVPGGSVISAAVRGPGGTDLVTLNIPITITGTGRATDSPPSLPPAAPMASSNPIPGVGIVVKRDASAAYFSKKGYDSWKAHSDMGAVGINTNPLYQGNGHEGVNPLHTGRSISPASSALPGEVSFHHVSLDLPCPAGPALAWVSTYRSKLPVSSGLGEGWDFSYNVSVEPVPLAAGPNAPRVIVRDGGGRADVFLRQPDGGYRCEGMFREGRFRNGVFTLTFADNGRWVFRPLDGSPGAGKISSIIDRNDVALTCAYDSSGLLSRVSDAFDRSLAVEWSSVAPSRIVSVSAQDGAASLTYQKIEFIYSSSRLASVSSPFEPGSPPSIGPVSFSYTEGLADPNLNGNLLSMRDGAGRLLDAFEYSSATDPVDPAYDTCSAQDRHRTGTAGAQLRTTFALLLNGGYEMCENDELGRVTVSSFDKLHRLHRSRRYTGFATPDMPVTTSKLPDPSTKLRPTDPDYFETSCAYNADSLCTRLTFPDGSSEQVIYDRDFRKDCPVRERGNARVVTLVSSGGEKRGVTCECLPGYGSPESARPGNPIKGVSVKCGGPSGSVPLDSPSSFTGGLNDDVDELRMSGINGGMPNRISMNVTVGKQTQGATFGEKVNAGLHAAGGALAHGVKSPRDAASGLATGKRQHSPRDAASGLATGRRQHSPRDAASGLATGRRQHSPRDAASGLATGRRQHSPRDASSGLATGRRQHSPRDASSGLATGRRQHSPIAFNDDTDLDSSYASIDDYDGDGYVGPCDADVGGGITYIGTCDASFATRIVTAHGQAFTCSYDGRGNLIGESGPISGSGVAFTYNTRGQVTSCTVNDDTDNNSSYSEMVVYDDSDGFASSMTADPEGVEITTSFDHDDLGRVSSITDPEGHTWSYGYDLSGNLISCTSPPSPAPIVTTATVDSGGMVVRVDSSHLGADGLEMAENPAYTTFYVRDGRGRVVRVAEEERPIYASGVLVPDTLGLENFAVVDFSRDAAGQLTGLSTPAISRGQTAELVCNFTYDERGLPHRVIRGGATANSPVITENDYDTCGALVRVTAIAAGVTQPVTTFTYDGFHRPASVTDAMGNVTTCTYDNKGFVTTTVLGELQDQPGSAGNVMLYRSSSRSGGPSLRAFNQNSSRSNNAKAGLCEDLFFDVFTRDDSVIEERFAASGGGQPALETTVVRRSVAGLPLSITCNGDSIATMAYDTAGRLSSCSDGSSTTAITRDKKGNGLLCGTTDHFLVGGVPDQTFTMTCAYDALGRCTSVTDGIGNTASYAWDSLGRCVSITEPGGLVVRMAYDGGSGTDAFSQLTSADVDGDGKYEPLCSSLTRCGETLYSADSYGHRTSFTCDSLGRVTRCTYPDSTYEETTFDALGRAASHRRKNGAIVACDFNLRGLVTSISHDQLPEDVLPVAATTFAYNGLGDCVRCVQGSSVIEWAWDSVGNALSETQSGRTVTRTFNHRGRTGITYADGRRFVESRDALGRVLSISGLNAVGVPLLPPVVVQQYAGDRVWRSTQANGVVTTFSYRGDGPPALPGSPDFSFDTCTEMTVENTVAHELAHVIQQRDRNQRVTGRQTLFTDSPQGPGRMQSFTRDALGRITGSMTRRREAMGAPPVPEDLVSYVLGKEGYRIQQTRNGVVGDYTQDDGVPPGDKQMGQYTTWPGGPLDWDEEGNLRSIGRGSVTHVSQYDAEGRLVAVIDPVTDPLDSITLVSYAYDAIGRRISRTTGGSSGSPAVTSAFVYDGAECIQEWGDDGTGTGTINAAVTFVSSDGNQHAIATRDGTLYYPAASASSAPNYRYCTCPPGEYVSTAGKNKVEHWGDPHENLNGKHIKDWEGRSSFSLMTNSAGVVTERFDCDDAGKPVFLTAAGVPTGSSSAIGPVRWMAPECLWEPSIGMLLGGNTVYSPDLGITVSRGNGHVTVLKAAATGGGGGGGSGGQRAQDHNSSRSNKTSS